MKIPRIHFPDNGTFADLFTSLHLQLEQHTDLLHEVQTSDPATVEAQRRVVAAWRAALDITSATLVPPPALEDGIWDFILRELDEAVQYFPPHVLRLLLSDLLRALPSSYALRTYEGFFAPPLSDPEPPSVFSCIASAALTGTHPLPSFRDGTSFVELQGTELREGDIVTHQFNRNTCCWEATDEFTSAEELNDMAQMWTFRDGKYRVMRNTAQELRPLVWEGDDE